MISRAFSEKATLASRGELLEHASLSVLQSARAGISEFVDWTKGNVIKTLLHL